MERGKKQRTLTTLALIVATASGGAAGYLLGRANALRLASEQLVRDATQILSLQAAITDEAWSTLKAINASHFAYCSDAEIGYFRSLAFEAMFLRDLGHIRDGNLECSAMLGRQGLPREEVKPDYITPRGLKIKRNLSGYQSPKGAVFVAQLDNAFVVTDPNFRIRWHTGNQNYQITILDIASQQRIRTIGAPPLLPGAIVDRDWQGSIGDNLYVTRCVTASTVCATVLGSASAALSTDRIQITLFTSLGALTGGFLELAWLFVRQRSQSMEVRLRRAIRKDELRMVYQPIVELESRRIVKAEALVRWSDRDGLAVGPDVFVAIAERAGFVGDLTRLVVRHALRDFKDILRLNPNFRLSVNVTGSDLADAAFLPMLERSLEDAGVEARQLAIEITESSTARTSTAIDAIHQLRQRGHSVQIDDFGTGHSSLAYLKDLAVDTIKIDKAFIQAIGTESVTLVILPQILSLAKALNLRVIVEGIETEEQAAYFTGEGKTVYGQGWLFGRPVPAADFHRALAKNRKKDEVILLAGD